MDSIGSTWWKRAFSQGEAEYCRLVESEGTESSLPSLTGEHHFGTKKEEGQRPKHVSSHLGAVVESTKLLEEHYLKSLVYIFFY